MTQEIALKQGATLLLTLSFFNDDGSTADLTTVTLAGQVRTASGDLVASLTLAKTSVANVATVSQDTSNWPIGTLRCDIKATIGGVVQKSETFPIRVNLPVTQ